MEIKDLILQTLDEFSQPSEDTQPTHQNISIQTTPTPALTNPFWQGKSERLSEECEFL